MKRVYQIVGEVIAGTSIIATLPAMERRFEVVSVFLKGSNATPSSLAAFLKFTHGGVATLLNLYAPNYFGGTVGYEMNFGIGLADSIGFPPAGESLNLALPKNFVCDSDTKITCGVLGSVDASDVAEVVFQINLFDE